MWDIYWKSVYDELVKNSELYKGLLEEDRKNIWLVKYYKAQNKILKDELKSKTELVRYYRKEKKRLTEEIGRLIMNKA